MDILSVNSIEQLKAELIEGFSKPQITSEDIQNHKEKLLKLNALLSQRAKERLELEVLS